MQNFTSVEDINDLQSMIKKSIQIKANPLSEPNKGKGKTIGLVFLNSSL
jgi:N-succinyl-L-ornithine transcarbamylase